MITVPAAVLDDTFGILRPCGGGKRECVAYWLGPVEQPTAVDEVVHPRHASDAHGYQVDDAWLTAFWFELARRRKAVRAQVHTHPDRAFHSASDDGWALVHTPGFLSLVIPRFALGPVGFDRAFLAERVQGGWRPLRVHDRLRVAA